MKLSVIIPAYNCEKYIGQTLDCIYAQTMPRADIEVIVCLDAPTDNTAAVVNAWAAVHKDVNLRILENAENRGVSYSRNAAARVATGDFIHFMDSDDLINTDFYRALYTMATETAADIAVASFRYQKKPNKSVIFDVATVVSMPQDKIDMTCVDELGMMWRYLIRREFWHREKFEFPEEVRFCEDWLLANRMVFAANYIALVPGAMYLYMCRENSLMIQAHHNTEYANSAAAAYRSVAQFLADNSLHGYRIDMMVADYQLFGKIRLFTIAQRENKREVRLFGRMMLMCIMCNNKITRRQRKENAKRNKIDNTKR